MTALIEFLFTPLILLSMAWSQTNNWGILHWMRLPTALELILAIIFFDLWMYFWHRLNHQLFFFWRFHRMHHSDQEMDSTTALRFHPLEILFSTLANILLFIFLGMDLAQWASYKALLLPVILWHHSSWAFPASLDQILQKMIVTPAMHRVHHSRHQPETDSNFSSIFSFWDKIFQTYYRRRKSLAAPYGLDDFSDPLWLSFRGMMLTPWAGRTGGR